MEFLIATFTDFLIPIDSNRHVPQKLPNFNPAIHRLTNIPFNKENYESELNIMKQTDENNEYNINMINNMLTLPQLVTKISA